MVSIPPGMAILIGMMMMMMINPLELNGLVFSPTFSDKAVKKYQRVLNRGWNEGFLSISRHHLW